MKNIDPYRNELYLRYFECAIRIRSDDSSALEWLQEFLTPAFSAEGPAVSGDWSVSLSISSDWFDELEHESSRNRLSSFDCFTLDSQFTSCQGWVRPNRQRVMLDRQYASYYIVSESGRSVDIVVRKRSLRYRVGVMRVVRELATVYSHQSGHVHFHAACFGRQQQAMIFAGSRRSGKTSCLLHALRSPEHFLIANDRVFIDFSGPELIVRGMPTIVHIRPSGLEHFPELKSRYGSGRFHHIYSLEELASQQSTVTQLEAPTLTQVQLCELLGTSSMCTANLAAIVLPKINEHSIQTRLHRLTSEDAFCDLRRSLFFSTAPVKLSSAFTELGGPRFGEQATVERGCWKIVETCDIFECQLGLYAYRDGYLLDRLWSECGTGKRRVA